MKAYRLTLRPLSKLETLHHSQNLFGFFCYQIKDRYDESTLEAMLAALRNKEKTLEISSIMPKDSVFWPALTVEYSTREIFDSVVAKRLKKIRFVSVKVLRQLLQADYIGDAVVKNIHDGRWVFNKDLLMEKEEIYYEYSLGIDIRFSSSEQTPFNVKSYNIQKNSKFQFYVRTDIEELQTLLHDVRYINLGKYKNVALNTYEVLACDTVSFKKSAQNILLSKYIPAQEEFDRERSLVKIEMAKSKLDNRMLDPYDQKHMDAFSVVGEGSFIVSPEATIGTLKKRPHASKALGQNVYYNGYAFLYPVGDEQ